MPDKFDILKEYFGYSQFREGQESMIDAILAGRDTTGIMPTGAGKSLCFQIPALLFSGITIVISPLISLMKDQVRALLQNGIKAAFLNSSLSPKQYDIALQNAMKGFYKIIYVAPERLLTSSFLNFAKQSEISMVTIDEAHCVSQWGQDFRPSYLAIPEFLNSLPTRPVVSAFTATATPHVREDIISLLELHDPFVLLTGFDRKNLYFEVDRPRRKKASLLLYLSEMRGKSGIVYCSTRKYVEQICEVLKAEGYPATRYHAGLSDRERRENQEDFLYDRYPVMVATNAFGMGIDKSNVSFVIHYNMPGDIESYYQEAGRAGRDGEPARCVLLYSGQDVITQKRFLTSSQENQNLTEELREALYQQGLRRLKEMTSYCHTNTCLRTFILRYFGETANNACGNCGNCNNVVEDTDVTVIAQKILSCVARTQQRYGVRTIMDTLRGRDTEKIAQFGLHQQSTYGLLADMDAKFLREIIQHLEEDGYLMVTDGTYPILKLGARAREVLIDRNQVFIKLIRQSEAPAPVKSTSKDQPLHPVLFDMLKKCRTELATAQNVPAYIIFTNASLEDMCRKLPQTTHEFLQISGVGNQKLTLYGEQFMEVIHTYLAENK